MIEFFLYLLAAILAQFIWRRYRLMNLRDKLGIPGPKPNYFFGNILEMSECYKEHEQTHPLFEKWKKEYGNIFGVYFGPSLYVVINNLEMSREILIKQFSNFDDRPLIPFMGQEPMSNMASNINGEKWKKTRNFLTPTFTTAKLKQMGIATDEIVAHFMEIVDEEAKNGRVFDIYDPLQRLTMEVIGKCAFAMEVKCLSDPNDLFLKNTRTFFEELSTEKSLWFRFCFLFPELNSFISRFRSLSKTGIAEDWIFKNLRKVIDARKKIFQSFKSVDVLQVLLEQNINYEKDTESKGSEKIGWMSQSMMEASIFTYLVAGFETTSVALGFTVWLLAKHQTEQKRLQKEIDEKVLSKEPVNYDTVHNMVYLDSVFKESLRLYPPVSGFVSRTCTNDCTINGVKFVKGVRVLFLPRLVHSDPAIWPDPERFNPDRFINSEKYNPQAWLPFGSGPRNCIGMRFADMEAKLCLFHLLHKYNIELSTGSEDPIKIREADLVMRPKNGVFVKLVKRN